MSNGNSKPIMHVKKQGNACQNITQPASRGLHHSPGPRYREVQWSGKTRGERAIAGNGEVDLQRRRSVICEHQLFAQDRQICGQGRNGSPGEQIGFRCLGAT